MKFLRENGLLKGTVSKEHRSTVLASFRRFARDIYKCKYMTPHEEMEEVMNAKDRNTFFESAVNTATDFICGKDFIFKSDDEFSRATVEKWAEDILLETKMREVVESVLTTGNAYLEQDFFDMNMTGGALVPQRLYTIPDASMMYINSDEFGEPKKSKQVSSTGEVLVKQNFREFYIQKINQNFRNKRARYYNLSYYGGSTSFSGLTHQVYGIPVDKRKIIHFKLNMGNTGLYGRSPLASAINDNEILYEIERSIAVLAKYKAVPRKIWSVGDKDNELADDELDNFVYYLENLNKEDDAWINKPVSAVDVGYAGQELNLEYAINHIKRKMIAGVSLDFLSGMGQDVNRATATQELLAFILSIYSKRKIFLRIVQKQIVDKFILYRKLKPVTIEFSDLDFETKGEKETRIRSNWQADMIDYNEMREQTDQTTANTPRGKMLYSEMQIKFQADLFGGGGEAPGAEEPFPEQLNYSTKYLEHVNHEKVPSSYELENMTFDVNMLPETKRISFKTLVDKYSFLFTPNPQGTELYYKDNDAGILVSFKQNNVMTECQITFEDIKLHYGLKEPVSFEDMKVSVQEFKNFYLRHGIKEE